MSERSAFTIKLLICGLMATAAIAFMAQLLWPSLGLGSWALCVLAGWGILAGLMLLLLASSAIRIRLNQWILRKDGTDTQWLWFPNDPPGLQRDSKAKEP